MAWLKVDDGFWSHPKTSTLSDSAVALWVRAGSYCCQHLTDGQVPKAALRLLGKPAAAKELVASGLWETTPTGWLFHDWDDYQESSTVVRKRREDARDRQRRSRETRPAKPLPSQPLSHVTETVTETVTDTVTDTVTHNNGHTSVTQHRASAVARVPDPTRTQESSSNSLARTPVLDATSPAATTTKNGDGRALAHVKALNATSRTAEADHLAATYSRSLPVPLERGVVTEIAVVFDSCIESGQAVADIVAGVREWEKSNSWHPNQIPKFIAKAAAKSRRTGIAKPTENAINGQSVAEQLITELGLK